MQSIGIALLVVGVILFFIGAIRGRQGNRVSADRGSVAIGGDNKGPISISNQGTSDDEKVSFMTFWNILAGLASVLGLALTLWPGK
jgi:hypothetical protein